MYALTIGTDWPRSALARLRFAMNSGDRFASRRSIIRPDSPGVYGRPACHYALAQLIPGENVSNVLNLAVHSKQLSEHEQLVRTGVRIRTDKIQSHLPLGAH